MAYTSKRKSGLVTTLADLKDEETLAIVKNKIEAGEEPMSILEELREGLNIVGDRFEKKEYFLSELVAGGELFKKAFEILKPCLTSGRPMKPVGKFVIGTAQGDIHDIGKNIVRIMLECNGFDVYDIGVDAPPEKFVEKAKEVDANIVGISALLTVGIGSMKKTIKAFEKCGLRPKVKIIIGGGIVNEFAMKEVGADMYASDAASAVKIIMKMLSPKQ